MNFLYTNPSLSTDISVANILLKRGTYTKPANQNFSATDAQMMLRKDSPLRADKYQPSLWQMWACSNMEITYAHLEKRTAIM